MPCPHRWIMIPPDIPHPFSSLDKSSYRNVWSAAELQAKNEKWQLVCANVFGLSGVIDSGP
jgi:hypothetical protein